MKRILAVMAALLAGCVNVPATGWIVEPAPPNQEAQIEFTLGDKLSRLVTKLDPPYRGADAQGTVYPGDSLTLVGVGSAADIGGWNESATYSVGASARWADDKTVEFDFPLPTRLIRVRIVDGQGHKAVSVHLTKIDPRYLGVRFGDLVIDPASGSLRQPADAITSSDDDGTLLVGMD